MKYRGWCPVCATFTAEEHRHSLWQVIMWLWDDRPGWKLLIIGFGVALAAFIASVVDLAVQLIRGTL